jgi:hypothetical protein
MHKGPRDLYFPADSWKTFIDCVAPKPRGMDPAFTKAMEQFERYSMTIGGEIGDSIRGCQTHLEHFLSKAQEIIQSEAGENSSRLGKLRDFLYGEETLQFQVFNYHGDDCVSIREDRLAELITFYDRFRDTMRFMDSKVEQGNLGILKNSFLFIHKPLEQAAELCDRSIDNSPIVHTTVIGDKPDPQYVHITGYEECIDENIEHGHICRILKPGYVYENREIQEGVVAVADKTPK